MLKLWLTYDGAKQAQYARQWQETVRDCDAALTQLQTLTSTLSAYLLDTKAAALLHLGQVDEVRSDHGRVGRLLGSVSDARIKALHDMHRGDFHRDQGEWALAETHYRAAQRRFAQLDDDTQEARCRRKLATVKLFQGDWREAGRQVAVCLDKFEMRHDHYELAKTYYAYGWVYNMSGDWKQATKQHLLGRKHTELHNDERRRRNLPEDDYLRMLANVYLGNDTRQAGDLMKAEQYLTKALTLSEQLDDRRERGWIYLQLARIELLHAQAAEEKREFGRANKHYHRSREYFDKSDTFNRSINYLYRRAMTLVHYSQWHVAHHEYRRAYDRLQDANAIVGDLGCHYYQAEIGVYLCDLYWRTGNPKEPLTPGQPVAEHNRLATFDRRTFRMLVQEVEEHHREYGFHHFMARLRVTETKVHLDTGEVDEAAKAVAHAFYHALNHYAHYMPEIKGTYQELLAHHRAPIQRHFVGAHQFGDAVRAELATLLNPAAYRWDANPLSLESPEGKKACRELEQFLRETR